MARAGWFHACFRRADGSVVAVEASGYKAAQRVAAVTRAVLTPWQDGSVKARLLREGRGRKPAHWAEWGHET